MIIRTAACLFDLDGTLISSIAATERVWGRWAADHGLDVPAFLTTMHGRRAVDLIGALQIPGLDPAVESAKIASAELVDLDGVAPIAGARRFVDALPPERWAIVTSAPRELALARLATAGMPNPRVLVSAEESPRGKPAPDGFLLAASRLGVAIADCLVFEDAPAGIEAGEAAGAGVIVVDALGSAHTQPGTHPVLTSYDGAVVTVRPDGLELHLPLTRTIPG
jgi:mannitol-1-/sugar-/sorbitol-6-phosphatase